MKSVLSAAAVVALLPLAGACVVVDSQGHITREERRFQVNGAPELHLTTFDGAIEVRSGADREVVVEIEKRGPTPEEIEKLQVDVKQDGNRINVEVKRPAREHVFGIGIHITPTAKLIVTMPKNGNVVARSGDGSIRVERVTGHLELRTGDGSIRGTAVGGDLVIQTGDGSVVLDEGSGNLDLDTADGSVTVAGKFDAVKLHTGDGSITLRAEPGSHMKDDWSVTTGDGGVSLYLPEDFDAQIDASTGDGTIRSELSVQGGNDEHARRSLRGRLGDGGKLLRIRTGDGSIKPKAS